MYPVLHELLMDKRGEQIFTCFSPYHLCWIAVTLAVAGFLRKRRDIAEGILNLAVGLYALDFFLMPLAYGYIDIEKLPFHVCTAMCLVCFFSRRSPRLAKYRQSFILLGFLSNLVYLCYPAGVMWHRVTPMSYRVIQTLLFHALMTVYGFIALWNDPPRPGKRELAVLTAMTVPAIFYAVDAPLAAAAGFVTALVLALLGKGLTSVALAACGAVYVTSLILPFF